MTVEVSSKIMNHKKISFLIIAILSLALVSSWAQSPPARSGHTIVEIDGKQFLFGGQGADEGREAPLLNDLFLVEGGEFTEVLAENPPPPRREHSAAASDGKMYVFYGEGEGNATLTDIHVFDPATNSWSQVPDAPLAPNPRREHTTETLSDGQIMFFGGTNESGPFPDLWRYNPQTNIWTQLQTLPEAPRSGHSAAVLNDLFYIFGGVDFNGVPLAETWGYNPQIDAWGKFETDQPPARSDQAYTNDGSSMFIIGGEDSTDSELSDVWAFNVETQVWTQQADLAQSVTSAAAIVLSSGEEDFLNSFSFSTEASRNVDILLFGGVSGGVTTDTKIVFDPEAPEPPANDKEVVVQIASLRRCQTTVLRVEFTEAQPELKVKLVWAEEDAKLCLSAIKKKGHCGVRNVEDVLLSGVMNRRASLKELKADRLDRKLGSFEVLTSTTRNRQEVEKNLEEVKVLYLKIRNKSKTVARNISLTVSGMKDNPAKVIYGFPVGKAKRKDKNERVHFVRLPEKPVRFHSKIFPRRGEETTSEVDGVFQWQYTDNSRFCFGRGVVTFTMP